MSLTQPLGRKRAGRTQRNARSDVLLLRSYGQYRSEPTAAPRGVASKHRADLGRGHRARDEVALNLSTPSVPEVAQLRRRLDALGDDIKPETARQRKLRYDESLVACVQVAHELSIDLQLVELILAQATKRRMTCSEVIDGKPHAKSLQLLQRLAGVPAFAVDETFSDLQGQ